MYGDRKGTIQYACNVIQLVLKSQYVAGMRVAGTVLSGRVETLVTSSDGGKDKPKHIFVSNYNMCRLFIIVLP